MKTILDFPFGELWEREVLHAAGSKAFITIKVYNGINSGTQPPSWAAVENRVWHWKSGCTYPDDGHYTYQPEGKYIYVGVEWIRDHLSPEGWASYVAQKIFQR